MTSTYLPLESQRNFKCLFCCLTQIQCLSFQDQLDRLTADLKNSQADSDRKFLALQSEVHELQDDLFGLDHRYRHLQKYCKTIEARVENVKERLHDSNVLNKLIAVQLPESQELRFQAMQAQVKLDARAREVQQQQSKLEHNDLPLTRRERELEFATELPEDVTLASRIAARIMARNARKLGVPQRAAAAAASESVSPSSSASSTSASCPRSPPEE